MKSLILYSTVLGAFYHQTDAMTHAATQARQEAGEDLWKRGYTGSDPRGATAIARKYFREANIEPVVPEGQLKLVAYTMNQDASGNTYPKLRVGILTTDGQKLLLSLDLKSDVAQRMIGKLANCQQGEFIKVSAWATPVNRGDRTFINHAVSIKDAGGVEIPSDSEFSGNVKKACDGVESTLKSAGINDKKVLATAKVTKRVDAYKEFLMRLSNRFPVEATA